MELTLDTEIDLLTYFCIVYGCKPKAEIVGGRFDGLEFEIVTMNAAPEREDLSPTRGTEA